MDPACAQGLSWPDAVALLGAFALFGFVVWRFWQ